MTDATTTRPIPVTRPGATQLVPGTRPAAEGNLPAGRLSPTAADRSGTGWLGRHKVEVAAAGAAAAVTLIGVRNRDRLVAWVGAHPAETEFVGGSAGSLVGITLVETTGLAVEPAVIRATRKAAGLLRRAAEAAQEGLRDARPVTIGGGALLGVAAGALLARYLTRQAGQGQTEPAPEGDGGGEGAPGAAGEYVLVTRDEAAPAGRRGQRSALGADRRDSTAPAPGEPVDE